MAMGHKERGPVVLDPAALRAEMTLLFRIMEGWGGVVSFLEALPMSQ